MNSTFSRLMMSDEQTQIESLNIILLNAEMWMWIMNRNPIIAMKVCKPYTRLESLH